MNIYCKINAIWNVTSKMTFVPNQKSVEYKGHLLCQVLLRHTKSESHLPCLCKSSDVISLQYGDIRGVLIVSWVIRLDFRISEWISGFQIEFLISEWISGFQIGFLPTVYEISLNATMYPEAGARRRVYFNPQHAYMHTRGVQPKTWARPGKWERCQIQASAS